jgi:hypothetical protein
MFVPFAKYNWNFHVEENEVGGACSVNGGGEDRVKVIDRKAIEKETTRETKT